MQGYPAPPWSGHGDIQSCVQRCRRDETFNQHSGSSDEKDPCHGADEMMCEEISQQLAPWCLQQLSLTNILGSTFEAFLG